MSSYGGFLKSLFVPDVTKIPPEVDAHILAIMDKISKTSLRGQSIKTIFTISRVGDDDQQSLIYLLTRRCLTIG